MGPIKRRYRYHEHRQHHYRPPFDQAEHATSAPLSTPGRPLFLHVEMTKAGIADAIARGMPKSDYAAWNVLDAYCADHLSDAALEWLVNNGVINASMFLGF